MTTTSLLSSLNSIGLATTANSSSSSGKTQSLTQSDFLKLLTTQLTHQDPTNPTDSNAFVSQMAQFSTVSGINDLLSSFNSLSSTLSSNQALQATSLVGQSVSAPGSRAYVATSGGSISGDFNLSTAASDATLNISNAATGVTVAQIDLGSQPAGSVPFTWNGLDNSGAAVNPGIYNVKVNAMMGGQNTAVKTNIQSKVDSVSLGSSGSGLQINLQGLGSVPFSNVTKFE